MKKFSAFCFISLAFTSFTHAEWQQWTVTAGGNGHYYEAVLAPAGINWNDAKAAAEVRGGYLATITSAQENTFVHNLITANEYWINAGVDSRGPWLGGYQPAGSLEP